MNFIDIHTHRDYFNPGVTRVLNIRLPRGQDVVNCKAPLSAGIHPWDSNNCSSVGLQHLFHEMGKIQMVGECGLDKWRGGSLAVQERLFIEQAKLAQENDKPLIIHCVGYFNEVISLKRELGGTVPWIIHGFQGHPRLAGQLANAGFFLSFGTAILNFRGKAAEALKFLPVEMVFLETDDSFVPIEVIYSQAAAIVGCSVCVLRDVLSDNFKRLSVELNGMV